MSFIIILNLMYKAFGYTVHEEPKMKVLTNQIL